MANTELDEKFIAQQKKELQGIKGELLRMQKGMREDQQQRADSEEDFTEHDSGDMSHSLFTRNLDATVEGQVGRRLEDVERALEKIDEGTYGLCDDTGEPIPKGRLEAVPEAIRTVEAQQNYERKRRPAR